MQEISRQPFIELYLRADAAIIIFDIHAMASGRRGDARRDITGAMMRAQRRLSLGCRDTGRDDIYSGTADL